MCVCGRSLNMTSIVLKACAENVRKVTKMKDAVAHRKWQLAHPIDSDVAYKDEVRCSRSKLM